MSVGAIDYAVKADGLAPTDKLVLILIANCSNDATGLCVPSQRYLAERSGLTRETVNRVIKRLEEAGHLTVTHQFHDAGGKRSNHYHIGGGYVTQDHIVCDAGSHTHVTPTSHDINGIYKRNTKREGARAQRLSEDWELPDQWAAWAREERPDLNPKSVAESFKDYWISLAGSRASKRDWFAVWRNWIRKEAKVGERKPSTASIPSWADLPRDDNKLADHARWHRLPDPHRGESFAQYRMRLTAAIRERTRAA